MEKNIHETRQPAVIAGCVVIMCLGGIAVALRLLSRHTSKTSLWYDDYLIIVALFLAWAEPIGILVGVHYGFGKHDEFAPPDATSRFHQVLYAIEAFYSPAIALTKLSILFFYARIFPDRTFKRYLYAVALIVVLWWIACQVTTTFECSPIHFLWTQTPTSGHCINFQKYFLGQAIPNIATDLFILALPLPQIWKLNLKLTQKLGLMGIFLLGGFVTFASIYRLVLLTTLSATDITYHWAPSAVWTVVEPNLGIVSACLPMLRPLYRLLWGLPATLKGKVSSSGRNENKKVERSSSFTRLREPPSNDQWKAADSLENGFPSTTIQAEGATGHEEGALDIPMGAIQVIDEVRWTDNSRTT